MLRYVLVVLLCWIVVGCAFSPQIVTVTPVIKVEKHAGMGMGRAISIQVKDRRERNSLGTLGGVYGESSTITLGNNIEKSVVASVSGALVQMGYVLDGADPGALQLIIYIDELVYSSPEVVYSNKVDMKASLSVEVISSGRKFSTAYRTKSEKRFAMHPNAKTNQQLISQLVSDTLQRMFDDLGFLGFISS